ncbi:hypothetical protein EZS27_035114, partial [termite gut metagenome]
LYSMIGEEVDLPPPFSISILVIKWLKKPIGDLLMQT